MNKWLKVIAFAGAGALLAPRLGMGVSPQIAGAAGGFFAGGPIGGVVGYLAGAPIANAAGGALAQSSSGGGMILY